MRAGLGGHRAGSSIPITRPGAAVERERARARSLALPLLALVVPWQAYWRGDCLSRRPDALRGEAQGVEQEDTEEAAQKGEAPANRPSHSHLLPQNLRLVVFDLAGTTLDDLTDGQPLAVVAVRTAFAREGVEVSAEAATVYRGLEKREAIRQLCREFVPPRRSAEEEDELVDRIHGYFLEALEESLRDGMPTEIVGASFTFQALRERGIAIFISSGFSDEVVAQLVERLGWRVDGLASARRPRPDAIWEAMRQVGVEDPAQVLKVGDTVADIEEGHNAGVLTAAVLTGTQDEAALRAAGPEFVLNSVAELPALLPDLSDQPAEAEASGEADEQGVSSEGPDSAEQPGAGQASPGQPSTGQPGAEQPSAGQPSAGGQPAAGPPAVGPVGPPAAGQPAAGLPSSGQGSGD